MLQDSLGGNSFTLLICTVSAAVAYGKETISSLRFAERAKMVRNSARKNIIGADVRDVEIAELHRQLDEANQLLEGAKVELQEAMRTHLLQGNNGTAAAPTGGPGGCALTWCQRHGRARLRSRHACDARLLYVRGGRRDPSLTSVCVACQTLRFVSPG